MVTFTTFAVGYLARPIGGLVLGRLGDKFGRRGVFLASIFVTSAATLGIGLVPTYASWGIAASVVVVLLRLTQGFCLAEIAGRHHLRLESGPAWRRSSAAWCRLRHHAWRSRDSRFVMGRFWVRRPALYGCHRVHHRSLARRYWLAARSRVAWFVQLKPWPPHRRTDRSRRTHRRQSAPASRSDSNGLLRGTVLAHFLLPGGRGNYYASTAVSRRPTE